MLKWERAAHAWEALTWSLAHEPEDEAVALNEAGTLWQLTVEGARSIGWPTISVVYSFDRNYVTIRDALFSEPKTPKAGRA